jgi:hypothetical protein
MPGSSRYGSEILSAVKNTFSKVDVEIFENPLTFKSPEPFIAYTRASLSEDRRLWNSFFQNKEDFVKIMQQIMAVADERIKRDGEIVMTKVVGGLLPRNNESTAKQQAIMNHDMSFYGRRVLFIGAHPDDIELGAGALIAQIAHRPMSCALPCPTINAIQP